MPTEPLQVSRPGGLRHRAYEQLVDEYNRLLAAIADLPTRSLWPHMQKAYEHQFLNRIVRIRRRLGLPAQGRRTGPGIERARLQSSWASRSSPSSGGQRVASCDASVPVRRRIAITRSRS